MNEVNHTRGGAPRALRIARVLVVLGFAVFVVLAVVDFLSHHHGAGRHDLQSAGGAILVLAVLQLVSRSLQRAD